MTRLPTGSYNFHRSTVTVKAARNLLAWAQATPLGDQTHAVQWMLNVSGNGQWSHLDVAVGTFCTYYQIKCMRRDIGNE